jgi:mono/diheme cytochrome c family protein
MRKSVLALPAAALAVLALSSAPACSKPAPKQMTPEQARTEARTIFTSRCSTCHGLDGKGKGPLAAGLNPRPRDYSDRAWQAGASDEEIRTAIVKGGIGVGKSALMPANPDLADEPQVVDELLAVVRSFGTDPPSSGHP